MILYKVFIILLFLKLTFLLKNIWYPIPPIERSNVITSIEIAYNEQKKCHCKQTQYKVKFNIEW
jgi:hypothetical protein